MNKVCRRLLNHFLGFLLLSTCAQAATYPDRPVTIVIPYAAGGVTDVFGRVIATQLSRLWRISYFVAEQWTALPQRVGDSQAS